jgi:molybdate transport repressor ModE-like protein
VEKDGELYLGWERAVLLERIDRFGSIATAARSTKLGYRNAWLWVEAMNCLMPVPLGEKTAGGAGGEYARLTGDERKAVRQYEKLRAKFEEFLQPVG